MSRVVLGAVGGAVVFGVDAFTKLVNFLLHAFVAERAQGRDLLLMLVFFLLFVAGGALCGWLSGRGPRLLRHLLPGALVGAMVAAYLTATWRLSSSAFAGLSQERPVLDMALIGAGLGATGGLLLWVIGWVRGRGA